MLLAVPLLTGCAMFQPIPPGGAAYEIEFNPDGTPLKATATVLNESESVELIMEEDADGSRRLRFKKLGTEGQEAMVTGIAAQAEALRVIVDKIPLP